MSTGLFQTRQFLLPKSGHQLSECEDAIGINSDCRRFAVADGATEAFAAQSWAQRLAHNWVQFETAALTPDEFRAWITEQGQALHESWCGAHLSWYAEEKARMGSFAAFVGVQLKLEIGEPCWNAIALGDACLIHARREVILNSLPVSNYESFNATPWLVPSHSYLHEAALNQIVVAQGALETGDVLLLLSDAAAAWYLMLAEKDDETRSLFELLVKEARETELVRLFERERDAGRIKDDDIAVVRIEVESL